jgi:hypothetical protein
MVKEFKLWAADRRLKRQERLYRNGFDYAAGRLLALGDAAVADLEREADDMFPNAFDRGILDAVRTHAQRSI